MQPKLASQLLCSQGLLLPPMCWVQAYAAIFSLISEMLVCYLFSVFLLLLFIFLEGSKFMFLSCNKFMFVTCIVLQDERKKFIQNQKHNMKIKNPYGTQIIGVSVIPVMILAMPTQGCLPRAFSIPLHWTLGRGSKFPILLLEQNLQLVIIIQLF